MAENLNGETSPVPPVPPVPLDQPVQVLVIDDEPYILRSVSYLLTKEGFTVQTATDGEEGLTRVRALRPPVVVLDIMMPRMDGYAVCEQIRQDPQLAATWVIILSAKGQQIDRERGLLGGADEYMTKPFSPRELVARVRVALTRAERGDPSAGDERRDAQGAHDTGAPRA